MAQGTYQVRRFSRCTGTGGTANAQGKALHRGCRQHGWLLLNGRCKGDPAGMPTSRHYQGATVLDLVLVYQSAKGDMRVLRSPITTGHYHTAIVGTIAVAPVAADTSILPPGASVRPAAVALTEAQQQALQETDWDALGELGANVGPDAGTVGATPGAAAFGTFE